MGILGGNQSLWAHDQTRAALDLGGLCLGRTASTCALCGHADRFDPIVERMIAPEERLAAPPALPPAFIVDDGRLGIRRTGKPASCHALDGLGNALGLFGLGSAIGPSACWANWLECTTRKRRSSTVSRPSAYPTSTWRTTRCPRQRRGGSCRVRPGFASSRGKGPCCRPHASNSCRTAHVRGTNVINPRRCSRHNPSVRLQ